METNTASLNLEQRLIDILNCNTPSVLRLLQRPLQDIVNNYTKKDQPVLFDIHTKKAFSILGQSFAKQGLLLNTALEIALAEANSDQIKFVSEFFYYLSSKKILNSEAKTLLEKIVQNPEKKPSSVLISAAGSGYALPRHIRYQSFMQIWPMLVGIQKFRGNVLPLDIEYLTNYILGVFITTKHTGEKGYSVEEAFSYFRPSIMHILECEAQFITIKHSYSSQFAYQLSNISLYKTATTETIYRDRILLILVKMLQKRIPVEEIALAVSEYLQRFKCIPKEIPKEFLETQLSLISTTVDLTYKKELYSAVQTMLAKMSE